MRDFHSIIEKLKLYLSTRKNIKILDKDVAHALQISQANFATIKRRNSIPYESILHFCKREELCCSEIFFDKSS
ncbi:hypothetical protein KKG72_11325 [bacterium]|nr:hypothetical protein [bacterium]MBU1994675.1 hypothetical protein [bacterium]